MNTHFGKRQLSAGNPLANALVVIVGALAIAASLILGFFAMIILGSILLVLAAIIGIRVWWLNRRLAAQFESVKRQADSQQADIIEGEYRIISVNQAPDRRPEE